jgi:hypothetical protein
MRSNFHWLLVLFPLGILAACTLKGSSTPQGEARDTRCSTQAAFCSVLAGSFANQVSTGIDGATIAGGGQSGSPNRVSGKLGTVGGGGGNTAGEGATVSGGIDNRALYFHTTIGGGTNNLANGEEATVGGGMQNTASDRFATVGGGGTNLASSFFATVSGGSGNTASFNFATVGGGTDNVSSSEAAVVDGGNHNLAQASYSAIGGGINNRVSGESAAISGGAGNLASGMDAAIPGGFANQAAGDYSFAAGREARVAAQHAGTFLFADASALPFLSLAPDEFAVRATGGVRFVTAIDPSGNQLSGVRLSPGSGSWETLSDSQAKDRIAPIDESQILDHLISLPISTWSYRGQAPSIRHIGPMAQDFYAAFQVGDDSHYISTVDEEGVALAAIQELAHLVLQKQITTNEDPAVRKQVASLETQLTLTNAIAAAALLLSLMALWKRWKKA